MLRLYTSSFKLAGRDPMAVSIARGFPRWFRFTGRRIVELAPTPAMLKMPLADYNREYDKILAGLDPKRIAETLGDGAIMLCFEPPGVLCHRRRVAEFLESALGIEIPELGMRRADVLPYAETPEEGGTLAKAAAKKKKDETEVQKEDADRPRLFKF
jgi:hypothetical protein